MRKKIRSDTPRRLVIRTDASDEIGGGHVMRCLTLATAWLTLNGNMARDVVFVCTSITEILRRKLLNLGFKLEILNATRGSHDDAIKTLHICNANDSSLILDGYCFSSDYQKILHREVRVLATFDDSIIQGKFHCDLLINQNLAASKSLYSKRTSQCKLLLGSRYTSIRKEFLQLSKKRRSFAPNSKILISLGLSDATPYIEAILQALQSCKSRSLHVDVLCGSSDIEHLKNEWTEGVHTIEFFSQVEDMAHRLLQSEFSILAAGGTANEASYLSTPMILLCIADNQRAAYAEYIKCGAALSGGSNLKMLNKTILRAIQGMLKSKELRKSAGTRASELFDGLGALRVAEAIYYYDNFSQSR